MVQKATEVRLLVQDANMLDEAQKHLDLLQTLKQSIES